jgi:hypothetical protein
MADGVVIGAFITSGTTIVGFGIHGWYVNSRLEKLKQRHASELADQTAQLQSANQKELETLKKENAEELAKLQQSYSEQQEKVQHEHKKQFEEFRVDLEDQLKNKQQRRDALNRVLNGASIANSGCKQLLNTARLSYKEEGDELFKETSTAFQQLSAFITAVREASLDSSITADDMHVVLKLQSHVFELLFSLDLDKSGTTDYENEVGRKYRPVKETYLHLQDYITARNRASAA